MRGWLLVVLVGCASDPGPVATITIEPASTSVEIINGAITPATFVAVGTRSDGSQIQSADITWAASAPGVGSIDETGTYTPTGELGGLVSITAIVGEVSASATLTVKLHLIDQTTLADVDRNALVHASEGLAHETPSQDPALAWAYPYDGTVFPRGLDAPLMMWNGGQLGDWYFVHLTSPTFELETYTLLANNPNDPGAISRFEIPATRWAQLTGSNPGNVDVAMSRLAAGVATPVIHHVWTIAPTELPGRIYYWTLLAEDGQPSGRLRALTPGSPAVDFLGDYRPTGVETCAKCHTPSADGHHVSLVMIGGTGFSAESIDYDIGTGVTAFAGMPDGGAWGAAALSAHGDVLVQNFAGIRGNLGIGATSGAFDPRTGASIANTGLEAVRPWMPSFSPNDQLLVYVDETPTPGGCNFGSGQGLTEGVLLKQCSSDLRALDWDPATRTATNGRRLVAKGADPALDVLQYPTVSPDGETVVYGRGPELGSLSHIVINPDNLNTGALYAVHADMPDVEARLDRVGAGYPYAAGDRDRNLDYDPSFAPVPAGGYAWVVFVSRRTYGNLLTGAPFLGELAGGVKQLWVAAIDLNAPAGANPSHPAFWLPGQDMSPTNPMVINQRARWALSP